MTILVRLNTEAPMGSTLQSLSSDCRSQSCDLAPVWMDDGVAWTCGSENSGRWPCILTWSLNHSTHITVTPSTPAVLKHSSGPGTPPVTVHTQHMVYYNITHVSHCISQCLGHEQRCLMWPKKPNVTYILYLNWEAQSDQGDTEVPQFLWFLSQDLSLGKLACGWYL